MPGNTVRTHSILEVPVCLSSIANMFTLIAQSVVSAKRIRVNMNVNQQLIYHDHSWALNSVTQTRVRPPDKEKHDYDLLSFFPCSCEINPACGGAMRNTWGKT